MKAFCLALFASVSLMGLVSPRASAADEQATTRTVVIHGKVLNPDGSPAAGVQVVRVGLGRLNLVSYDDAVHDPATCIRTDSQGRFESDLRSKRPGDYQYVVAPSAGNAGGISARIVNINFNYKPDEEVTGRGMLEYQGKSALDVTIQLKKGITVSGSVVDLAGTPCPGTTVTLYHDLRADSHAGGGGQFFERSTLTDGAGQYQFTNVLPTVCHLKVERPEGDERLPRVWLRTKIGQAAWQADCLDVVSVPAGADNLKVDIGLVPAVTFVTSGKVVDQQGRPLAHVKVVLGCSHHATPKTWSDKHYFNEGITDSNGEYQVKSNTPWLRFISARLDGYQDSNRVGRRDEPNNPAAEDLKPGHYDFTMTPVPQAPAK